VQYLKWRPKDQTIVASLQFLGSAMLALSKRNPLTESFIAQLEVDLEGTGINLGIVPTTWAKQSMCGDPNNKFTVPTAEELSRIVPPELPINSDAIKCSPLFELRDSQSTGQPQDNSVFQSKDVNDRRSQPSVSPYPNYPGGHINLVNGHFANSGQNPHNHLSPDSYQLPSRSKDSHSPYTRMSNFDTEMDFSTASNSAKSRSDSYKDSSSHNSFTPPSQHAGDSATSPPTHPNLAPTHSHSSHSGHSPSPSAPTPGTSGNAADVMFFEMPDHAFNSFQPQLFTPFEVGAGGPLHSLNGMGSATMWEMGNIGGGGTSGAGMTTGLTPLASGVGDWEEYMGNSGNGGNGNQ
jgi:hypothetical protein